MPDRWTGTYFLEDLSPSVSVKEPVFIFFSHLSQITTWFFLFAVRRTIALGLIVPTLRLVSGDHGHDEGLAAVLAQLPGLRAAAANLLHRLRLLSVVGPRVSEQVLVGGEVLLGNAALADLQRRGLLGLVLLVNVLLSVIIPDTINESKNNAFQYKTSAFLDYLNGQ